MPRLPALTRETAPPATRKMIEAQQGMLGMVLNPIKLIGYCLTIMKAVGLIPSDPGVEDGKETGQHVSHYIEMEGAFERACAELVTLGFEVPYVELWGDDEARKKKAASKKQQRPCFC